jgi:parallel beta-helix repeat protein
MKIHFRHLFVALAWLALATLNSQLSIAFAQGSLTPPGAPAPTMKSLDQVEARTIVNAANTPGDANDLFIISQPGSYYLTTNITAGDLKNGIVITTNNVTLDLNGFAVQGSNGSSGIVIPNASANITLRNGTVSGWNASAVLNTSPSAINLVCERLNVSQCGYGIYLNGSGVVRDCNTRNNNNNGITCVGNGGVLISGCIANAMLFGDGIDVGTNCTVKDCTANANGSAGIYVAGDNCQIADNTCSGNSSYGIEIIGVQNRVDNNSVGNNISFGIFPNSINVTNSITRNSSPGAGYGNTAGNTDYAPIGTPNTATSPWENFH